MSQPFTVVTLKDEDGDYFPIRLPGVYRDNRAADIESAMQILAEHEKGGTQHPRGNVTLDTIEYFGAVAS